MPTFIRTVSPSFAGTAKAADAYNYLDLTKVTLFDGKNADKAVFEINGQKFAIGVVDKERC